MIETKQLGNTTRVLIILGHPRPGSFCEALADTYVDALPPECERRRLNLEEARFDLDVHTHSPNAQDLEPDLVRAREDILWANHLVFVFPTWWGMMPARLKGFLDRLISPDFAFRGSERGYEPLLKGRTGQIITTMDKPVLVYRFIFHSPGTRALGLATLGFCGVRPVRVLRFGPVKPSTLEKRQSWMREAARAAQELPAWHERLARRRTMLSWLKIARLQFYVMTLLSYGLGASMAARLGVGMDWTVFWLGFATLFLLELASVLTNELHDLPADRLNRNHGPFNGGSRVLVEEELSSSAVRRGRNITLALTLGFAVAVGWLLEPAARLLAALILGLGLVLGPGYTAPPLRLSWRGWGELDVAFTHSAYMVLAGWILQGGAWNEPIPYVLSLPMGLAIFASIILAGMPDAEADATAGKETLVARVGPRISSVLALASIFAAAGLIGVLAWQARLVVPTLVVALFILHTGGLAYGLTRLIRQPGCRRIDGLLFVALNYVLWFSLGPLLLRDAFLPP